MSERDGIYREIDQERKTQDDLWGGSACDDRHRPNDWIAILCRQLGLAASDAGKIDLFRYRRQLVRLASTAVAALESLDRQTVVGPGPEQRGKGF
jgi:hypothetical protein